MNVILGAQETVTIYVVDVPSLFRGKLHSAASRKKSTDIQDLCFIATTYAGLLKAYRFTLRQDWITAAIRNATEMRMADISGSFSMLGVDVTEVLQLPDNRWELYVEGKKCGCVLRAMEPPDSEHVDQEINANDSENVEGNNCIIG